MLNVDKTVNPVVDKTAQTHAPGRLTVKNGDKTDVLTDLRTVNN